jgi:tetratricopeptide (TPR) repeat protein
MKKILIIFILIGILFPQLFSQSQSTEELFDDAEFFFTTEEYEEALYLFLQLIQREPENANFNFRTGMTYLNIPGEEVKAIPYLEKATNNISLKYKAKDLDEYHAPHHAWFYLGNAYRINNQLEDALLVYEKFKDIRNFEKKYNIRIVENEIKVCERAKIIKDAPINLIKKNLGKDINPGTTNYFPVVNSNETVMVFMQSQKFYEALMFSYKSDGRWVQPINITPQIGSDGDLTPAALSDDGKELLLVKRSNRSDGDIYISRFDGQFWTSAVKLGSSINTIRNEAHASFAKDGKGLYFSSDRRGGFGGLDLYFAARLPDNSFGEAINLGSEINTPQDETSVFLRGNTLFFCSKGHFNMGGYDIFFSEKEENGSWSESVNIGFPLNTTNDDSFFQPVGDGTTGYIALYNQNENFGFEDIYRVEILPATVPMPVDEVLFNSSFRLLLNDESTGEKITIIYLYQEGDFKVVSTSNKKYRVTLEK